MSCQHTAPETWAARVKDDTSKPYRIWRECPDCGKNLGDIALGPSNDRIPRAEKQLAAYLSDVHLLWAPGKERNHMIAVAVERFAEASHAL